MVEYQIHKIEPKQSMHVETIEIPGKEANRFFLTEDLAILLACNSPDSAGQLQHLTGFEQVIDFSLCYEDPSTGEIVKIKDLDPREAQEFNDESILRLRYEVDGEIEEARFVHKKGNSSASRDSNYTTPRMRRMMHNAQNKREHS